MFTLLAKGGLCAEFIMPLHSDTLRLPRNNPCVSAKLNNDRAFHYNAFRPCRSAGAHFNIVIRPEPEGGLTAIIPALPGCVSYGRTLDEAKDMAKDAIVGYIESLRKRHEPFPQP